ncbi:MAG: hypothetical protein Q9222_002990 [Ikaeria aurantiellina]
MEIATYLSTRLLQWSGPDSGKFREIQLRTLIGALALLHHSGLTELSSEPHNRLRSNIAGHFTDIVDSSELTLEHRVRKANALYLIRLVSQYFSLIKNSQPLSDALPIPILGLVLAGASAASGQFAGLRSVFEYADDIIGRIPGRLGRHLNLPALQEFTRNAAVLFARSHAVEPNDRNPSDVNRANQVVELVQELLMAYSQEIPSRKDNYGNWPRARTRRGPPSMNKWYFFYGLLDCAKQLAGYLEPGHFSNDLILVLGRLLRTSDFEEFRWKVLEIFVLYETTRTNLQRWLDVLAPVAVIDTTQIWSEVETIRSMLGGLPSVGAGDAFGEQELFEAYEQRPPTHRERTNYTMYEEAQWSSYPNTSEGTPLSYSTRRSTLSSHDVDAIRPYSEADEARRGQASMGERASIYRSDMQSDHRLEHVASRPQYFEEVLEYWPQSRVEVNRVLPPQSFFRRGYAHAGLSTDCTMAFFHTSTKVAVYRVTTGDRPRRHEGLIMDPEYEKKSPIVDVVLSDAILAVSTRSVLELHQIRSRVPQPWNKKEIRHGDWEPSGIAICERSMEVVIAVGHRLGTMQGYCEGRIVLYRLGFAHGESNVTEPMRVFALPRGDFPRYITFDGEATMLACITDVKNAIHIWNLQDESPEDGAHHPYMLCTTSASTDRYQVAGEWSFVSPVALTADQATPPAKHDFVELKAYRQLVTGAVSNIANKFAVMEKTGKILILDLNRHELGGICSRHSKPEVLGVSLCELKTSRATTSCLRFDPSGTRLFALDPEGKLITATFAIEE